MVALLSPAARRALSREISRSLEASCSCRRSHGLRSTSAGPGTSPRMIPTSNFRYTLTFPATSNTARCSKFGIRYLPRVRARISALFSPVFVRIPYTTQSGSSQPGDQAGPAAETLYCPLSPQEASWHNDLRSPHQRMFRRGLVTCGSPSTTRFVSMDTVLSTYLSASGAEYPRLTVERAFHRKVD